MSTITKYQSKSEVVNRSQIKLADYNPRRISDSAFKRLKKNIKERGLMGGLVWNRSTGNLVAGHQRIAAMDQLNKYDGSLEKDYKLRVEVVELSETQEKEQNIFMNSQSVQGEFEYELLKDLMSDIDYEAAGLDEYDLNMMGLDLDQPQIDDAIEELQILQKPIEEQKEAAKEAIKEKKRKANEVHNDRVADQESYVTISFDSYKNKSAFMLRFGFQPLDKFIKGEVFSEMIERVE